MEQGESPGNHKQGVLTAGAERSLTGAGSVPLCSRSVCSLHIGGGSTKTLESRLGEGTPKSSPASSIWQKTVGEGSGTPGQSGWRTTGKAMDPQHQGIGLI